MPTVETLYDYSPLNDLWETRLRPRLDQVAQSLLAIVVQNLAARHRTLSAWQAADAELFRRSAIEPHDQDTLPEGADVLINVARDCLEHLASNQSLSASHWCDRLVSDEAAILRRLAVHTLSIRGDLTADQKIDWLLSSIGLHDFVTRHETYRALRIIYPDTSPETRPAIIDAILTYTWPIQDDDHKDRFTAQEHFNWFDWLHKADPNCEITQQSLEEVLERYPGFQPTEHPDLHSYTTYSGFAGSQSPWSVDELLSRPASEWVNDMLSFVDRDPLGPNRDGLLRVVKEASTRNFEWGLALADALANPGHWDADLWPSLMSAWSSELDENKHRRVISILATADLHRRHVRSTADLIYTLVKGGGPPYAAELRIEANQLANALEDCIDRNEPLLREGDWFFASHQSSRWRSNTILAGELRAVAKGADIQT